MHHTRRIALLEDNSHQLEKLEAYLSQISNVEIVLKSKSSEHFFEQLKTMQPDILVADLDLGSDSMTGIEVSSRILTETKNNIMKNPEITLRICFIFQLIAPSI